MITAAQRHERIKLVTAVCSLSAVAVLAKVFGLAEKVVIAHTFGADEVSDVYFASTTAMFSIVFLVKELVSPSLLPVLADSLLGPTHCSGRLFRQVFWIILAVVTGIALCFVVLSEQATKIFAGGFSAAQRSIMARMLQCLGPALLFQGLCAVTGTVLNAHKRFLRAACPEAALKLFVVLGLIVLAPSLGLYAYALAMGLGSFGCLLVQLAAVPERRSLTVWTGGGEEDHHLHRVFMLMLPLTLGVVSSHVNGLVDNYIASSLPPGQLSYLGYSKKLIDAILMVGPVALVTVVYTRLSHLAAAGEQAQFAELVSRAIRVVIYLSLPMAVLLISIREPLIRTLLQRGHFTAESTLGTSQAFVAYAVGLTVLSLEPVLVHSYFALCDTRTPVLLGILATVLDIVLAVILSRYYAYLGIAVAFLIAKTTKVVLLAVLLDRRLGRVFDHQLAFSIAKQGVIGLLVLMTVRSVAGLPHYGSWLSGAFYDLLLPSGAALLVFATCSSILRIEEFDVMLDLLRRGRASPREAVKC